MIKLIGPILIFITLLSCSKNESSSSDIKDNTAKDVVSKTDEILLGISENRALTSATLKERQSIIESLSLIKNTILKIQGEKDKTSSFKLLNTYMKRLDSLDLMFIDDIRLRDYKHFLNNYVQELATKYAHTLVGLDWLLYESNFSNLWPFVTSSSAGDWVTDWSLGASYAKVRGYGNKSWLISPLMDFSLVKNPTLRIHHMIMADGDSRSKIPFDRKKVLNTTFKIMISKDYQGGDPLSASWQEVKLTGYPATTNFHASWSDEISLPVTGLKNVSIALFYNMDDRVLGRHYVSWQVNKFQIFGSSRNFSVSERVIKKPLYIDKFQKLNLGKNKNISMGEDLPWGEFSVRGQVEFAKIEASIPGVDSWLLTPRIEIDGINPILKIKEVARNIDVENFKLLISTNYNGGNPQESNWKEFNHVPNDFNPAPDKWENFNSLDIPLSEYIGKSIVIAFQYKNETGDYSAWEIDELIIDGEGESLNFYELQINYSPRPQLNVDVIYEHHFSNGLSNLDQVYENDENAKFIKTNRNDKTYVEISGFKNKNHGKSILKTLPIKLGNRKTAIQVEQSINHLKGEAKTNSYVEIFVTLADKTDKKYPLPFKKLPSGNSWKSVVSEWYELPSELLNKEIIINFSYTSNKDLGLFPSWNLYFVKLGEISE